MNASEWLAMAEKELDLGRTSEAERCCREAMAVGGGEPDADIELLLGRIAHRRSRKDEAVARLRRAAALRPQDARMHSHLGCALRQSARLPQAAESYRRALRLRPDYAEAEAHLGLTLRIAGDSGTAIAHLESAVRQRPTRTAYRRYLVEALQSGGLYDRMLDEARIVAEMEFESAERQNSPALAEAARNRLRLIRFMVPYARLDIVEAISIEDAGLLDELARSLLKPEMRMAEIGCWKGSSTAVLARVAAEAGGLVDAIDTWGGEGSGHTAEAAARDVFSVFRANLQALGVADAVRPHRMASAQAVNGFPLNSFDLVFIDGDHRYSAIRKDLDEWFARVKPGGVLCGHDCENHFEDLSPEQQREVIGQREIDYIPGIGHPGVIFALHEKFGRGFQRSDRGSSIWWMKKAG